MNTIKLKSEERRVTGRKLKSLRKGGVLPGNLYGKGIKSESLQVNLKEFLKVFKEVGETGIITLEVGGKEKPVLISNVQFNPKTDEFLHVDLRQVNLKEKIEAQIPVVLIGESPAEKQSLGTVVLLLNEVTVEALPMDLPEKFEVNIENLTDVDQAIYLKDLKVSKEVELKTDTESLVAKVEPPQKEEVVEAVTPAVAEGESQVEGETPTESNETSAPNSDQVT